MKNQTGAEKKVFIDIESQIVTVTERWSGKVVTSKTILRDDVMAAVLKAARRKRAHEVTEKTIAFYV